MISIFSAMTIQRLHFLVSHDEFPRPTPALLETNLKGMLNADQSNGCGPHP